MLVDHGDDTTDGDLEGLQIDLEGSAGVLPDVLMPLHLQFRHDHHCIPSLSIFRRLLRCTMDTYHYEW